MTREEALRSMSEVRDYVSAHLRYKIEEIIELCEKYRYKGREFTFAEERELDARINSLLIELSDELVGEFERRALEDVEEDDRDAVLLWINREQGGQTLTERVDSYSSHLKHLLEAYIAIGFANVFSSGRILTEIMTYISNPYASPLFRDAVRDGGYASDVIAQEGYRYGQGIQKDVMAGYALAGEQAIYEGFQYELVLGYRRDTEIIGYVIHRGSTYDCPYCDSFCERVWPLDQVLVPLHTRCRCWVTPVSKA